MTQVATAAVPASRQSSWPLRILLGVTTVLSLRFIVSYAVPYLSLNPDTFGAFWPRRYGLLPHLGGGTIALLVGPIQFWLGEHRRHMHWHRRLGTLYMASVAVACVGGYYLALTTTDVGWVYSSGLVCLATVWAMTTSMAYVAIKRRVIDQHREWMIRSYVVTMAFVFFRLFDEVGRAAGIGNGDERAKAAAWLCWAVPLVVAEPLIQAHKLKRRAAVS